MKGLYSIGDSLGLCHPCSTGSCVEVAGHALVSAGPKGPERHQPGLTEDADRSWRSEPMWVHLQRHVQLGKKNKTDNCAYWTLGFVCILIWMALCLSPQGRYPPAMLSSMCFSHVGSDLRWSVPVPAPQKPWLSPSAGQPLLLPALCIALLFFTVPCLQHQLHPAGRRLGLFFHTALVRIHSFLLITELSCRGGWGWETDQTNRLQVKKSHSFICLDFVCQIQGFN